MACHFFVSLKKYQVPLLGAAGAIYTQKLYPAVGTLICTKYPFYTDYISINPDL